jgi:hypothetical protein
VAQGTRDARLGLTGLTPEQREQRIRELERRVAEERAAAKAQLEEERRLRPIKEFPEGRA